MYQPIGPPHLSYLEPDERREFGEREFLDELDSGMLDIDVQQYGDIIDAEPFKKLGFDLPGEVLTVLRHAMVNGDDDPVEVDSPMKQKLVSKGFLEPVAMANGAEARPILKSLLKARLAEEGKRLGLKNR